MNRWLGFLIAVIAVVAAFYVSRWMRPLGGGDIDPVGFHARGQVKINGATRLIPPQCTAASKTKCTLTFDFSFSLKGTPDPQSCDAIKNCLSFSNPDGQKVDVTIVFPDSSANPTPSPFLINGRVEASQ